MNNRFNISVEKLTNETLMRKACEMTFMGTSKQSLTSIYKSEHSPVRTQMFWVEFKGIPLFVSTHLLRHHVGSIPYQLTCREDRKGGCVAFTDKIDSLKEDVSTALNDRNVSIVESALLEDEIMEQLDYLKTNSDRLTPVNLGLLLNAQSLIDMAKLRLCLQAHKTTVAVFKELKEVVRKVDPELAEMMVVKCVYRNGLCGEPKPCGYNLSKAFQIEQNRYNSFYL